MSRRLEKRLEKLYRELKKKEDVTLDDIGFVGTQQEYSEKEWKEIVKKTGEAICATQAAEKIAASSRSENTGRDK